MDNIKIANRLRKQANLGIAAPIMALGGSLALVIPTGLYQAYKGIKGLLGGEGTYKYGIPAMGAAAIGGATMGLANIPGSMQAEKYIDAFSKLKANQSLSTIKHLKPGVGKLALPFIAAPIAGTLAYKALDSI